MFSKIAFLLKTYVTFEKRTLNINQIIYEIKQLDIISNERSKVLAVVKHSIFLKTALISV